MTDLSVSLKQIAKTHANPMLFSSGIALALTSLLNILTNKFKITNRDEKLNIRAKDKIVNQAFISLGIDYPTINATSECMLAYDPIPCPIKAVYSHEAKRIALYLGTEDEFLGPFFADSNDMGIIVYLIGMDNIILDEVANLIVEMVDIYKHGDRGFYTYVHGQKEPVHYTPIWPLGLLT
jgi:hypothetical protein